MWYIAIVVFLFHAILAIVDEVYFHHKRGLGLWERLGHPADTLTVLACYSVIFFFSPTEKNIIIYIILAIFSCIFVTKDEFVHSKLCVLEEMWLHAFLFLLHPILFILVGLYWLASSSAKSSSLFLQELQDESLEVFKLFFLGEFILTFLMMFYQIIYWNFLWKGLKQIK
ncbi:MAG: hypothetical protein HY819_22650 [Acidobacteria bacterium]|nr:hypothetical protein [Acidobacteriota bacterium]